MAKYRNKTATALEVRIQGRPFNCEPDAVVEIPDDLAADLVFPETIWDEIEPKPRKTAAHKEN